MVKWLSSWLAEQEVRGSIPGLTSTISEIGYLQLSSRDMAERSLKRRKSSGCSSVIEYSRNLIWPRSFFLY